MESYKKDNLSNLNSFEQNLLSKSSKKEKEGTKASLELDSELRIHDYSQEEYTPILIKTKNETKILKQKPFDNEALQEI